MAEVYDIYIDIYDVSQPADVQIPLEYAEKNSIQLVYEGSDNKYTYINASRLEFSMEVNVEEQPNTDLHFDHLFTGNESKYNVRILNVEASAETEEILWQGYMLPDSYQEPYDRGTFYVKFTATDGLGKLKGHDLEDSFYTRKQSVVKTIADCLKKTKLSLPIYIAPGIKNNGAGERWDYIFLDGLAYIDEEKKSNCYEILESCLQLMGATLQQEDNRWYIMGFHRKATLSDNFLIYNALGEYQRTENTVAQSLYARWYDTPVINLLPPFKSVEITTGVNESNQIFPENIVEQRWVKTYSFQQPPLPLFWKGEQVTVAVLPDRWEGFNDYTEGQQEFDGYVGFVREFYGDSTFSMCLDYYLRLGIKPFVKENDYLSIDLSIISHWRSLSGGANEGNINDDTLFFELTLNGNPIVTNIKGDPNRRFLDFNIYKENFEYKAEATLEVKRLKITESGYLDFKLYHPVNDAALDASILDVMLKRLIVTCESERLNPFIVKRNIEYTNTLERSIVLGDTVLNNYVKGLQYQLPIAVENFEVVEYTADYFTKYGFVFIVSQSDGALLEANKEAIYIQKNGSDYQEWIEDVSFIDFSGYVLVDVNTTDNRVFEAGDKLMYRTDYEGNPQTIGDKLNRERWQTSILTSEVNRLGTVLAKQIHSIYPTPIKGMEGVCEGLVWPRTALLFQLKNEAHQFIPMRTTIDFNSNQSKVFGLQKKRNVITDYE